MEKLKQKLSSRKLWAAILAGLAAVIVALCGEELTPEIIAALKCAVTAAVAYIFGEGAVDVARLIAEAFGAQGGGAVPESTVNDKKSADEVGAE